MSPAEYTVFLEGDAVECTDANLDNIKKLEETECSTVMVP